jgi:hypothetical protein
MIKPNEGNTDRVIRVVLGSLIILISYVYLPDNLKNLGLIFGSLLLITGVVGWCSLYALFGINTCPVKVKSKKK